MFYAVLVPLFLSWSAILGTRAQQAAGSHAAFVGRTTLGFLFLTAYALAFGQGLQGAALPWFLCGGIIGFGLGDICLFSAYARLGARMTLLLWQCLAAPLAGGIEWAWLGTLPGAPGIGATLVILVGVALVLMARTEDGTAAMRGHRIAGVLFGLGAALGQALATVFSRHAYAVNEAHGFSVDGMTAAFQRILGGMLVVVIVVLRRRLKGPLPRAHKTAWFPAGLYMLANAVSGPVLGIGCLQAALLTMPSAIVMGVAATAPVMVIPFAWWFNRDRPAGLAILGSLMAVAGVALLIYMGA